MCAYDEDLPPFDSAQRSLRKNTMLNILTEPVIRLDLSGGVRKDANLPEVFAALVSDKVVSFPALRPHQRHAWHAFLVQLGAMAMHRAGWVDLPDIADEWAKLIRGLTPDFPEDEPWQLVVEDITKPAFMQAPASSKEKEKDFKAVAATPDELDILVTSKNHDLKSSVASRAAPGDWLFALVTLQTMEGFGGAGNYGVSRMNGGFGSRPAFTLAPVEGLGAHLRMDIVTLLDQMGSLAREFPMRPGGIGLVWTVPWDGARVEELLLERLHPFYIEVCRRIRLRPGPEGNLAAVRTSSKAARIEARNLNGRTGDPWTPVNTKDGKSLTLASGGFRYNRVVDYFSAGDWKLPVLWNTSRSAGANTGRTQLVARAMVRGQGQTAGYHERVIPLRPRTVRAFGASGGAADLETIARGRIEKVRIVQRILSHAIQVFLARGEESDLPPEGRRLARLWLDQLDKIVDARFFEDLQDEFDLPDQAQRREKNLEWQRWLAEQARQTLHSAMDSLPCPAIHRYRARVRAEGLFEGRIRGNAGLPEIRDRRGEGVTE